MKQRGKWIPCEEFSKKTLTFMICKAISWLIGNLLLSDTFFSFQCRSNSSEDLCTTFLIWFYPAHLCRWWRYSASFYLPNRVKRLVLVSQFFCRSLSSSSWSQKRCPQQVLFLLSVSILFWSDQRACYIHENKVVRKILSFFLHLFNCNPF